MESAPHRSVFVAQRAHLKTMREDVDSEQVASMVERLCDAEGEEVVLRFTEALKIPTSKYDGRRYQTETVGKATLHANITRASVEDLGETLMCDAYVPKDEMERIGIDPSVVWTRDVEENDDVCRLDIRGTRKWWLDGEYEELSIEEARQAIEDGREDEILPPWDESLSVCMKVERTSECKEMSYDSDFHIQYDSPETDIGELMDIRVK